MTKELPADLIRRAQSNLQLLKEQQDRKLQKLKAEWESRRDDSQPVIRPMAIAWPTVKGDRIPSVLTRGKDGQPEHTYFIATGGSIWQSAVESADEGNLLLLCELLCVEEEVLDDGGRALINDLLDRHQAQDQQWLAELEPWSMEYRQRLSVVILADGLKRKHGRPATPIYARSDIDARLDCAAAEVRAWKRAGSRHPDLVRRVAELHNLDERSLKLELKGKRGATQRKAERRKKAFKGG
ncbi:MAG TPA: hypothetical protein VGH13_21755 [Xanthobacteraceae bacterium]|jgi:hypothetical protein